MLLFEYLCMYVWLLLVKLNYILKLIIIRIKLEILAKCLKKAYPNSNWKKEAHLNSIINLLVGGLLEVAVFGHLLKKMEFLMLFQC